MALRLGASVIQIWQGLRFRVKELWIETHWGFSVGSQPLTLKLKRANLTKRVHNIRTILYYRLWKYSVAKPIIHGSFAEYFHDGRNHALAVVATGNYFATFSVRSWCTFRAPSRDSQCAPS